MTRYSVKVTFNCRRPLRFHTDAVRTFLFTESCLSDDGVTAVYVWPLA